EYMHVSGRHPVEEASLDEGESLVEHRLVADRLGEVEDDPAHPGMALEQRAQERAVAAAHVDDGLVAAEPDDLEPLDPPLPVLLHRAVEDGALLRVRREPWPELLAEHAREGRTTACVQICHGLQPDAAEEMRERVPAVLRERLRLLGVAEGARRDF